MIKDYWWLIVDYLHTENADDAEVRKRTLWGNVNHRNLNGGPQADDGGERQLENNKHPQMSQMDTDGGPQADDGGEQQLSKIGQQLKGNYWWLIIHTLSIKRGVHQATQVSDWWLRGYWGKRLLG